MDGVTGWNRFRNYEMSVWTLQDSYIATLKSGDPIVIDDNIGKSAMVWPLARAQGQIQNGQMEIDVDGTLNLSFDIPMYIYINGEKIENPNWYNAVTKNVLVSMRKIKVIFNKWLLTTREERSASTFEFIILKVLETHELDNLICHVECEGLAFHELGKIGYKYALSAEEFYNLNYEWNKKKDAQSSQEYDVSNEELGEEPIATIDYWMTNERNGLNMQWIPKTEDGNITDETVAKMDPTVWYFDVRMSHSSLLHEENVTSTLIYEEGYPSDWDDSGDTPTAHEATKEMARLVDLKESNIYNITLDLAEKFLVFCRYEYIYNNNYNIIGRVIVFYNNFLLEGKDVQTLMYPNSATKIMREMDSTDISTKMFVRSVDAEDLYLGEVNIMDCTANMSREDYLLNFDYLHDIGTISKELYEEVNKFLKKMRTCNSKIVPLLEAWSALSNFKPEIDAKVTNYKESIELDLECITLNAAYMNAIDAADGDADGYITRDYRNPLVLSLLKDSENTKYDTYYVLLNLNDENRGIKPDTLKLFKENNTTATVYYRYGISFTPWSTSNFLVSEKTNTVNIFSTPSNITTDIDYRLTYKGNIDNSEDVLPDAEDNNKGWYYRITLDNGYLNYKKGDLILSDGKKWHYIVRPNGTAYESGYFLYTKTITIAVNGPTTEVCTCKREGAVKVDGGTDYTSENYITQIRHLYYTTMGDMPKKPVVETKFTSATEIVNSTTVSNKWSSEIGVPDDFTLHSGSYKLFGSWEFTYKSKLSGNAANKDNKIKYSSVAWVTKTASKPDEDSYNEIGWKEAIRNAGGSALTGEVKGKFVYDEYHNLDKVTGIFVRSKIGTYNSYKVISEDRFIGTIGSGYISSRPHDTNNNNYSGINSLITSLSSDATANDYPSIDSRKGKYVVIKKTTYHINGNITLAYDLKYHDNGDINTSPTLADDDTKNSALLGLLVLNISPIFYLDTKNSNASAIPLPNSNTQQLSIVGSNVTDKWTTILPDKTKNAQKYYSGWAVTFYDNTKKYYVLTNSNGNAAKEDTSLSKKSSTTTEDTSSVPKYLYATFKYKPNWYYENIKKAWKRKLDNDSANVTKYETKLREIAAMILYIRYTLLENELNKKNTIIRKFEHMMGAALRESYWQPEDEYLDYGSKFKEQLNFPFTGLINKASTFYKNSANKTKAYSGWDIIRFDNESEAYYEVSTNRDKIYYPMIDLTALGKSLNLASTAANRKTFFECYKEASIASEAESYAFFYNPTNETIPISASDKDIRYCDFFTIGSRAHFAFVSCPGNSETTSTVKPVLILTDASSLSDDELLNLYKTGYIGKLKTVESDNNILLELIPEYTFLIYKEGLGGWNAWLNASIENGKWVEKDEQEMKNYRAVSPRILIPSLKLKTDSKYLTVKYDGIELEKFKDYYLLVLTYYKSSYLPNGSNENSPDWTDNNVSYIRRKFLSLEKLKKSEWGNTGQYKTYYTITIKPEYILAHYPSGILQFDVTYHISNADMSIYLDAKKILKENAYPKVAYEIEVSRWSPDLLKNIYTKLAQIVMINDTDLKLQDTFGYISNIKLDLDHEEKDSVEVKNYKTKFEDLFSKIVAETEEMHKNSRNLSLAGALVGGLGGSDVKLSKKGMEDTLSDPSIQDMLLDFMRKYFDGADVVLKKLKELWDEAGAILGSAATSLDSVMGLTTENASILAGFRENVLATMTPKIFTGDTPPTNFKPGDIWINDNDGYRGVATGYGGSGGFVRTYDGKLSEITGASFTMDAATGTIDILGLTAINLKSGQDIYIAANDTVNIVGNKEVNIGGTSINIVSSEFVSGSNGNYTNPEKPAGVHLIASRYQADSNDNITEVPNSGSFVDIDGNGIVMASRTGITIKSGEGIKIYSSNESNEDAITEDHGTAAVKINATEGIWLGSNKPLRLYSGDVVLNDDGSINSGSTGANIELSSKHLLLGVANVAEGNATAIELSDKLIILAAGGNLKNMPKNADGTVNIDKIAEADIALAGVQIKSDYIGMAVGLNVVTNNEWTSKRSLISIESGKIKLGTMRLVNTNKRDDPTGYEGEYIWMADNDFYIGGMGNFTLNTNNIKLQTKNLSDAKGTNENNVNGMGFALGMNLLGSSPEVGLGFWIKKNINGNTTTYEKHLVVDGDITALTFVANSNNGKFKAKGDSFGLYTSNDTGILTIDSNGYIRANNRLYITASNLYLGTGTNENLESQINKLDNLQTNFNNLNTLVTSTGVPKVTTTGIIIDKNRLALLATANLYVVSGGAVYIGTSGNNTSNGSAIALTADGITLASNKDLIVNILRTNSSNNIVRVFKIDTTQLTNNNSTPVLQILAKGGTFAAAESALEFSTGDGLKVKGALTATSLTVGSGDNLLTYTASSGLVVKGNITATSGSIGEWSVGDNVSKSSSATVKVNNILTGGERKQRVTLVGPNTAAAYSSAPVDLDKWAMYAGAEWPEDAPGYSKYETPGPANTTSELTALGWAPFRVQRNGVLYAKDICVGNGPSTLGENGIDYGTWTGYTGYLWFWVHGKDDSNLPCYKWIKIDGQALLNTIEDVATLWNKVNQLSDGSGGSVLPLGTKPKGCFIAGTKITLLNGDTIPIEKLLLGMKVLSYNENTNVFCDGEIIAVLALKHKKDIYDIYFTSNEKLTMTMSHPILTTKGWKSLDIEASFKEHKVITELLQVGDEVILSNLKKERIKKIIYRNDLQDVTVYNCGVDECHTFIANNVIVHNAAFTTDAIK